MVELTGVAGLVGTLVVLFLFIVLVFIMLLANDKAFMGELRNSRLANLLGWATVVTITTAVLVMFGAQLLGVK